MNTSKILNILFGIALILMTIKIVNMSNEKQTTVPTAKDTVATKPDSADLGQWKAISPMDIKNSVELFSKDWMALAVGHRGNMNAMTIAWGALGELWGRHVVTVYVSRDRYTYSFMERNQYFTVTAFPEEMRSALQYIGTHSGRDDHDKIAEAGLTPEFTRLGNPIFEEGNLAIECRIIYKEPFKMELIDSIPRHFYDKGTGIHTMYIGEIVNVWKK